MEEEIGAHEAVAVAPHDEHAVVGAGGIVDVVRDDAVDLVSAPELHGEHGVALRAAHDGADVGLDGHLAGERRITTGQRAGDVAAQAEAPDQPVPGVVEQGGEALAAEIGMHADVGAVQPVALRIVVGEPVVRDGVDVAVLVVGEVHAGPEVGRARGHPARGALDHRVLPLGEYLDVRPVVLGPHQQVGVQGGKAGGLDGGERLGHRGLGADDVVQRLRSERRVRHACARRRPGASPPRPPAPPRPRRPAPRPACPPGCRAEGGTAGSWNAGRRGSPPRPWPGCA